MSDSQDDHSAALSEHLYRRRKLAETNAKDDDLYDFAGQCYHREICGMPDDTHNSV